MTHTKDTREAIARIIEERAEIGVSGDAPLDPGVSNPEELADAILTALEPASQAGGDVRALVAFAEMVRDFPIKNKNMPHGVWLNGEKHTGPIADWFCGEFLLNLKAAAAETLAATPAQADAEDPYAPGPEIGENPERVHKLDSHLAEPTPERGEVDGLVAELASIVEGHVKALYLDKDGKLQHPAFERKYKRDMEIVHRARTALESRNS